MSHTLARRIAVGSGVLAIALTTVLAGMAAADESTTGTTVAPPSTVTSTAGEPTTVTATSTSSAPSSSSTPSSSTSTPSSSSSTTASTAPTNPSSQLGLTAAFDQATYNSGDDVSGKITITNTDQVAHLVHMSPWGDNVDLAYPNWPAIWPGMTGVNLDPGSSVVLNVTGTITDAHKSITLWANLIVDSKNTVQTASGTASVVPTTGSIDGTMYFDANGNGQYDPGEGLPDVQVTITGGSPSQTLPAQKTDKDGHFVFTDIPSGSYTPTFGGLGGLVTPWTPWRVKDQRVRITEEARHKVSDTLAASVKLNADSYAVGDTAQITVTLTNSGDHDVTGITAWCDRSGDSRELGWNMAGWGDLRDGHGVTVPAHATMTVDATEAVPADAAVYGSTGLGCDFGQFDAQYQDGTAGSNFVTAKVSGAVASVEGTLVYDKDHDGHTVGVPGVTLNLTDHDSTRLVAHVVTDADGKYAFSGLPAGSYDIGLVGSWKLTDGESTTRLFRAGDNPGQDISVEPVTTSTSTTDSTTTDPSPTDASTTSPLPTSPSMTNAPTTNPPTADVPVVPADQASPDLAYTGVADAASLAIAAIGALVCGVSLVLMSRRRHAH